MRGSREGGVPHGVGPVSTSFGKGVCRCYRAGRSGGKTILCAVVTDIAFEGVSLYACTYACI